MSDPRAELSSLATAVDEITQRISGLADRHSKQGRDELAHDLFDVERSLRAAGRRLDKLVADR